MDTELPPPGTPPPGPARAVAPPGRTRLTPTRVASETFVIHDHAGEGTSPSLVPLNAMVIRSAEPVVVDTGMPENRATFLADVFSIVEPQDIRWVFLTHDDVDHTGNLEALVEAAPKAIVVVNWFMRERMGATLGVPPLRQRWVGDDERLDVGDRTLITVRPPVYDSPTTRGLFDPTTGVYWSSDGFASPMPAPVRHVAELDPEQWNAGMEMFNQYLAPWITIVDDRRFQATVDRVEELGASVIAGAHTPIIGRDHVDDAIEAARRSPLADVAAPPGQEALDALRRSAADD